MPAASASSRAAASRHGSAAAAKKALLLVLMLCSCATAAAAAPAGGDGGTTLKQQQQEEPSYTCSTIDKVPAAQRCNFIRESCPAESLVPYAQVYYCYVAPHNVVLRSVYVLAVCCLLPLAFCLLGDTAEFYIAPIMAHVSQAIPKMRPRFAGVTFVALGNGAPDLSANIAAISAGEVVLSAGALTGAAMFVQCVVAAELVALAGDAGIKCGGAMLRDVGVYALAISSVLLAFALGQVTRAFVGWAIALYILYMAWVFAGDEWHQAGRPQPQLDPAAFRALLQRIASRNAAASGGGGALGDGSSGGGRAATAGAADLEESLLPWVEAEEEEEAYDSYHTQLHDGGSSLPPAFEAAVSSGGASPFAGAAAGGGAGSLLGLRPSSLAGQGQQHHPDRSTELSSVERASSSAGVTPTAWQRSSSSGARGSRRVSAPAPSLYSSSPTAADTFAAASASVGGAAPVSPGWSTRRPDGAVRAASATLPGAASMPFHRQPRQQQQRLQRHSSSFVQPHMLSLGRQSYIDPKTYKQLVWADLADDDEEEARLERQIARQLIAGAAAGGRTGSIGPSSSRPDAAGAYWPPQLPPAGSAPSPFLQQQQQSPRVPSQPGSPAGAFLSPFGSAEFHSGPTTPTHEPAGGAGKAHVGAAAAAAARGISQQQHHQQHQQHQQEADGGGDVLPAGQQDTWAQLQWQVTLGNSEEWADAGRLVQGFRRLTFPLLLPAYLGQRLTIPFASSSGYSREWLIVSLLCCPLALVAYLGLLTLPGVLAACGAGIAASLGGAALTAWDAPGQMAAQGLGSRRLAAAVPGCLAVLAFVMGVVWIDTVATEVVGAVTFLAHLASLPDGVMGLTLLAWGNSLGDYFGNRAMARAGHTSTAITACFAAPLFNMLISLAAGFSSYLHKLGSSSVAVTLTPEVALGCLFLVGYNAAIIATGRLCGQRLPPWFRHFARAWYAAYFCLAVASGFRRAH